MSSETKLALWRAAHLQALAAEDQCLEAATAHARGQGPEPDPALEQQARQLRQQAQSLLQDALQELQVRNSDAGRAIADFHDARERMREAIRLAEENLRRAHVADPASRQAR